ncbi:MAG: DUF2948 family protein [Hyphomonadaceae bacterium]|nr:DUF2948 family protein [Hyphomonadaceae bacterium]
MAAGLKLIAEDAEDLEIISAAAQDALVRVQDLSFDAKARRFTLVLRRFRWETAANGPPYERVNSALSFHGVLAVKTRKLRRDAPEALAAVLSVMFMPGEEAPAGAARIVLAGGGEISLDLECVDASLIDVGAPWRTPRRPEHEGGQA